MTVNPEKKLITFCFKPKDLQSQMNTKIFSDLLEFIKSAHKIKTPEMERTTVIQEIPTAALITGKQVEIPLSQ